MPTGSLAPAEKRPREPEQQQLRDTGGPRQAALGRPSHAAAAKAQSVMPAVRQPAAEYYELEPPISNGRLHKVEYMLNPAPATVAAPSRDHLEMSQGSGMEENGGYAGSPQVHDPGSRPGSAGKPDGNTANRGGTAAAARGTAEGTLSTVSGDSRQWDSRGASGETSAPLQEQCAAQVQRPPPPGYSTPGKAAPHQGRCSEPGGRRESAAGLDGSPGERSRQGTSNRRETFPGLRIAELRNLGGPGQMPGMASPMQHRVQPDSEKKSLRANGISAEVCIC